MYSNYQKEPDYPAALGLFSHLNADELKELLNDDIKFDDMMKDVKQVSFVRNLLCIWSKCKLFNNTFFISHAV
jgi:hypothetical protein